ncbi:MAG: undecaprenyl-phosphate glucose phosphotransferase [Cycloclasticus sp.]|nr:MAG: undecaprenyl-phosphate glucose phosphotransferase [Cycloclasticus sp.]
MEELIPQQAYKRGLTFWIQWIIAMAVVLLLLFILVLNKSGEFSSVYQLLMVITVLIALPVYTLWQVYPSQGDYLTGIKLLGGAWGTVIVILAVIGFATKTGAVYSREVLLTWGVLAFFGQALCFAGLHTLSRIYFSQPVNKTKVAIIGVGDVSAQLEQKLNSNSYEQLIGVIAHEDADNKTAHVASNIIGSISQLNELIQTHKISRLYIALPISNMGQVKSIYFDLFELNVDVIWMPDLQGMMLLNNSISDLAGMPAIHLNESPLTANKMSGLLKNTMDKLLSVVAVLVLSPLMLMVCLGVKLSSLGPIIFKQKRHGWNGKVIEIWKFRSMTVHDDNEVKQAVQNDSRVTSFGRFIRCTSIDELPQFFNVLMGDMSLVGPRPHALEHNDYYTGRIDAYMARHRIKPGITGLAQINGFRGETETIEQMKERVDYDLRYINNWSIGLDISILLKTPLSLLSKDIY